MAASRRGQPPLSVRLPQPATSPGGLLPDRPPISALFLIDFDVKAGYTIAWKQAVPGLELEGVVEYKSLPSGLHTVPEDLIYFIHQEGYAGLSAFVNARTEEEETRHARMIAVGVLVPLIYGRLGRAWRHAENVKDMASKLAADRKQTQLLEKYWEENGARESSAPQPLQKETPLSSPALSFKPSSRAKGHSRNRSASDGAALIAPGHRLSPFHPAWSLTSLLDTFGPLIFPIHRAALLRKRILISTHAPVHQVCNFVYDISILSNIPQSVCDVIDTSASAQRLRPLFTVGVHDIAYLLEHEAAAKKQKAGRQENNYDTPVADEVESGWVACTTDSILAVKEGLWDMLITMPPAYSSNAKERVWPTVEYPKGVPVKATQRDLRRFRSLGQGLARLASVSAAAAQAVRSPENSEATETTLTPAMQTPPPPPPGGPRLSNNKTSSSSRPATANTIGPTEDRTRRSALALLADIDDTEEIVEPTTWAALAYNGFMWWASAGEKGVSDEVDEAAHDAALLADLVSPTTSMSMPLPSHQRTQSFGGEVLTDSVLSLTAGRRHSVGNGGGVIADEDEEGQARIELAIIAYFHRLTSSVMSVLANIVESSDEDDMLGVDLDRARAGAGAVLDDLDESAREEEQRLIRPDSEEDDDDDDDSGRGGWVRIGSDALAHMGLDVWSKTDAEFVRELTARYFHRRAYVEVKGVEVCGLRVC
ncbi:LCHN protein [Diplogelasinospora grovesii]|uniref:LCHN protein n=1 Tax=Diplogelasinospora grovesii TaxID=303347 RepID=A0AAN6NEG0_9PEZI|nr:LCHN protein [Diplogelasinospora grovesii]